MTGGGQYDSPDFADLWPMFRHFRCYKYEDFCETVPAFRWKNGRLSGLALNGEPGNDREYLYVHLQKRAMKFTPGLEDEDSFMIVPNEFVKDHELTQEEIASSLRPDPEYERVMLAKIGWGVRKPLIQRIKSLLTKNRSDKIFTLKRCVNKLLGRKLSSKWKQRGISDTYTI